MSLYEDLEISPNATPEEIKKAHRKAVRRAHPDASGKRADFDRVQRAYLVLTDESKRARYDADGTISDLPENMEEVQALNLISEKLGALINDPKINPLRIDILAHVKLQLLDEKANAKAAVADCQRLMLRYGEFKKRLTAKGEKPNRLAAAIEAHVTHQEQRKELMLGAIRTLEIAHALVDHYEYLTDEPEPHMPGHPTLTASVLGQMFREAPGGGGIFG